MAKRNFTEMVKKNYRIRSRKKFESSPNLNALLEKMSFLEPKLTLRTFNDALKLVRSEKPNLDDYEALKEAFRVCFSDLPVELQNFVNYGVLTLPKDEIEICSLVSSDVLNNINNRIFRYEDFRLSRLKLSRIAYLYEKESETDFKAESAVRAINEDFGGTGLLQVDEKGVIQIVSDSFGEAIKGTLLDRIRRCVICERVFWASNKNSKTCSPNHGDIYFNRQARMRNKVLRKTDKDSVNEKRRTIYRRKKEQKQGKVRAKKRDGNL